MIHPTADVQSRSIGENTNIWQFTVVLPGAVIGSNCNINCHCFIENEVEIGDSSTIKSGVYVWDGVSIGARAFIGPNVTFTNDLNPRSKRYPERFERTRIGDGASIGANSTIVAGIAVGEGALIGAGSVVTRDVPPYTLWYGNPARMKGFVCACGNKLVGELACPKCGARYEAEPGGGLRAVGPGGAAGRMG